MTSCLCDDKTTKFKVLVTHPDVPKAPLELLRSSCEVIVCESVPSNRSEILEKARGMHALYWACHEPLNAEVLDVVGPQLKSVSTMSAGIDYVDVAEFKQRQIPLGHTPHVLSDAVADLAIGLMLAAARRFHEGREKIATSNWENYHLNWMLGQDIRGATVGFFGFGSIGQMIAKRLSGFDIDHILYTTRSNVDKEIEQRYSATNVTFEKLLAESDIIFAVAPLTDETVDKFNATAFSQMKRNAVFVNVSRGQIVNQKDLYNALQNKQIFAAGLDVMVPEPLPANDELMALSNCILLPHLGSATERTRSEMAMIAAQNVLKGLAGEAMVSPAF